MNCRAGQIIYNIFVLHLYLERTRSTWAFHSGSGGDGTGTSAASSAPQSLSTSVWSCNCFMPIVQREPPIATASVVHHTTLKDSAKAFRTSSLNGCSSVGMTGIVANAISAPCGNCSRKEAGSFLLSPFCRMAPPTVIPQIYVTGYQHVWEDMGGTDRPKVTRKDKKGHRRRGLSNWYGCQDWEECDNVNDSDSTSHHNLKAERLGDSGVLVQRCQQPSTDNCADPANEYQGHVLARFLQCDARRECDETRAV
jgi:hypothetical protein